MTRSAFEKLVREVLKSLPKHFKDKLSNIDVVIEEGTGEEEVLGLYEGVSLKDRGEGYSGVLPDKITLFKRALEADCREHGLDLRQEVRDTILHEIAHHFGMTDAHLREADIY